MIRSYGFPALTVEKIDKKVNLWKKKIKHYLGLAIIYAVVFLPNLTHLSSCSMIQSLSTSTLLERCKEIGWQEIQQECVPECLTFNSHDTVHLSYDWTSLKRKVHEGHHRPSFGLIHCKKGYRFPVLSWDVTYQTLPGRENYYRPERVW